MIKVSKTNAMGKFLYINLHGFKDEQEQERLYQKIKLLTSNPNMTVSPPVWSWDDTLQTGGSP